MPEKSESTALTLVKQITDNATKGSVHISGAKELAESYLKNKSYKNNDERVHALIKWESRKNFAAGFITGIGGLITLPVSIPTSLLSTWVIQARLCAAIAHIYGHDIEDEKVKTIVLLSIMGDFGKEFLKDLGLKTGKGMAGQLIKNLTPKIIYSINEKIGFKLINKFGQKTIMSGLNKTIPIMGGVIGGTIDAAACKAVGETAKYIFSKENK